MNGFSYRGHFVRVDPEQKAAGWEVVVAVEVHAKGDVERIYYHDHLQSYATREEAAQAAVAFGKRMIDDYTVPAVGEGDYRG